MSETPYTMNAIMKISEEINEINIEQEEIKNTIKELKNIYKAEVLCKLYEESLIKMSKTELITELNKLLEIE